MDVCWCLSNVFCFVVRKSSKVSHIDSAAVLRAGVRAHTALFSYANIDSRSVVAVFSAASVREDGLFDWMMNSSLL